MTLQAQREGTEKRISVARRDYIQAVQVDNTELRTFPGRIWAAILYSDMAPRETFTQPESVAESPQVNLIRAAGVPLTFVRWTAAVLLLVVVASAAGLAGQALAALEFPPLHSRLVDNDDLLSAAPARPLDRKNGE